MSKRLNRCMSVQTKGYSRLSDVSPAARAAAVDGWRDSMERLPDLGAPDCALFRVTASTPFGPSPAGWTEVVIPTGPEHSGSRTAPVAVLANTSGVPTASDRTGLTSPAPDVCRANSASFSCPSNHEVMI